MIDKVAIGRRLAELREAAKAEQADSAAAVGKSRPYISGLERGHDSPGLEVAAGLAKLYDASLDYLILGRPSLPQNHPNFAKTAEEIEWLGLWRDMEPHERASIIQIIRSLLHGRKAG